MSGILAIQLFGEFQVTANGAVMTALHQPRLQSLLAYLLLHRHAPQSRQQMAFLIWPDSSEAQARANLRKLLYYLHRALPAAHPFLLYDKKNVQWNQSALYRVDVVEFDAFLAQADTAEKDEDPATAALVAAINLYHGDLLPACYADWPQSERDHWRARFITALEKLLLLLESQRNYAQASLYAQRLLRHDPLHEATYRHLMRLYTIQGDRANALRVYHTCVSILRRELDVPAHPITYEAYTRLVEQDLLPPPLLTDSPHPAREMRLVGRQAEWATLHAVWLKATHEGAHFVLLAGVAGIGKSRLAGAMRHWVEQQGMATAYSRSYAAEGDMAYAPVIEWLQSAVLQAALPRLTVSWRSEIARLLPQLRLQYPDLPPLPTQTETWQRQQLFEALAQAFLLAKAPLLLVIDDLQWCDQETLEWLPYLLRVAGKAGLLIIGTVRSEELAEQHPLFALLLHLRIREQVTEIAVGPLDATETTELAAQVMGQPLSATVAAQFYQASEGNPLFVVEMARAVASQQLVWSDQRATLATPHTTVPLPPKVQAVIQARLAQLSPTARQ